MVLFKHPEDIVSKGKNPAYRIKHANILPNAESDKPDREIPVICRCRSNTAADVRQGLLKKEQNQHPDVKSVKYRLIAAACSQATAGYAERTMRMPADRTAEMNITDSLPYPTVRRTLKKMDLSRICVGSG